MCIAANTLTSARTRSHLSRNGILLCDLASALTGAPVRKVCIPPRSTRSARTNILVALDHLGLLSDWDESLLELGEEGKGGQLQVRGLGGLVVMDCEGNGELWVKSESCVFGFGAKGWNGLWVPITRVSIHCFGPSNYRTPVHTTIQWPQLSVEHHCPTTMQVRVRPADTRGYAVRAKERQLKQGLGLIHEVDKVLQVGQGSRAQQVLVGDTVCL